MKPEDILLGFLPAYQHAVACLNLIERDIAKIEGHKSTIYYPSISDEPIRKLKELYYQLHSNWILEIVEGCEDLNKRIKKEIANGSVEELAELLDNHFFYQEFLPEFKKRCRKIKLVWKITLVL